MMECMKYYRLHFQQPLLPTTYRKRYSWSRSITRLHGFLFVLICCLLYIYSRLLVRYGSISPIATALYTTTYNGRTALDYPISTWKPSFRVVISLTTTPNRLNTVMDSIYSLTNQSLIPDQIYLNIPQGRMKRHPERYYNDEEIPQVLKELEPLVKINRCVDDGPATKLLGALRMEKENDPDTLIITVDDDFIYPKHLVFALAWEATKSTDTVLGVCGWGMIPIWWDAVGIVPAYVPYFMRPQGRYVDILQACCGNAYRLGFFHNIEQVADMPDVCITVDDVWIAGYLQTIENRSSAIISKRLDPIDPEWKSKEAASASRKAMTLSSYNHQHQIHYKCVEALEKKFQKRWKRNFET